MERATRERLDEWLELRNRIDPEDPLELDALVRRRERDPHHVDLLARVDGIAAGVGSYGTLIDHPGSKIGRVTLRVLPAFRRRGVATALHRAASELARAHGDAGLEGQVAGPTAETAAYCAARGYRAVERMWESRLDLTSLADVSRPAASTRTAAEGEDVLEDAYAVALEAEPDIPQAREWVEPRDFADWRAREIDAAAFVADASVVLYVDGRPAAYALLSRIRASVAEHHATGVARAFRGRGLAEAVKRAQIVRAREARLRELVAWNDESNAPMRHVNLKLGYRITREVVTYRGPLL